jgi:hypothetical protein
LSINSPTKAKQGKEEEWISEELKLSIKTSYLVI